MGGRPSSPRRVRETLRAARLVWSARSLFKGEPVLTVLERLQRLSGASGELDPYRAHCATLRAARGLERLGLPNTCLLRSMVLGTLLAGHPDTLIHLGFELRPRARGHAWVSVNGRVIPGPSAACIDGAPCDDLVRLQWAGGRWSVARGSEGLPSAHSALGG